MEVLQYINSIGGNAQHALPQLVLFVLAYGHFDCCSFHAMQTVPA